MFLKEPHINTATYREALQKQIDVTVNTGDTATDTFINTIIEALKHFQMDLAEGIQTARLNGKQIGQRQGAKLNVKKKAPAMEQIKKYSKDFDGTLKDTEVMQLVGLARNTYYKYKNELKAEA